MQAVLFDLYGTLVDIWTDESDMFAYNILSKFLSYFEIYYKPGVLAAKYQEKTEEKLMAYQEGPFGEIDVYQVFEEILVEGWRKQPERSMVVWLARLFRSLTRRRFRLYEDAQPVLDELQHDYQLGIVSDAQWVFSEPEIRMLGLDKYFDPIVLSSRYFIRKPDPQIYAHALRAMRIEPDQALYVGNDPDADVAGPRAIGMPVILIDRDNCLRQADVRRIPDLREIPKIISDGSFS